MSIGQLRAFLAAVSAGSFTGAAKELDVSQASVSELIRRLEEEVGAALFVRGGRRLLLTAAGEQLRPHAEGAVSSVAAGVQAVASLSALESGTATFGVLRNAAYYALGDLVQRFHQAHPNVQVRLIGLNSVAVAGSVARGEIEAGLVVLPVEEEGLLVTPLLHDEVFYVSGRRTPEQGPVSLEELAAARLVLYDAHLGWRDPTRRQLLERARLTGLRLDPVIEVEHVETALSLVALGIGDTIVCSSVARSAAFPQRLHLTPFAEPLYDTVALVRREMTPLSPATQELVSLARQLLMSTVHRPGLSPVRPS